MKSLLIDYNPSLVRAALVEDGTLVEFHVEHNEMRGIVGNIYKGKVENVVSGMKASFVNIGLERNGFLYVGESLVDAGKLKDGREPKPVSVSPGDVIMCQVVKDEFGTKGARLTTDITLPGYFLVLLPNSTFFGVSRKIENEERRTYLEEFVKSICPQNMGFIIRSAADKASDEDIATEAERLIEMWKKVESDYKSAPPKSVVFRDAELLERAIRDTYSEDVESVVVNEPALAEQLREKAGKIKVTVYDGVKNIFRHYGIAEQINRLADRRVNLDNGAYLVIDKTEALTVIDVNTGHFVGGKDLEDTVFKTNIAAADEIAKQLRVRNISGIVVIDFIDMTDEGHKAEVVERLKQALKKDRLKTSAVEMTALGLVELTRKKAKLPVDNFMLSDCPDCMDGHTTSEMQMLFVIRDEFVEFALRDRIHSIALVKVHPAVFDKLFEINYMPREVLRVWKGKKIYFLADKNCGHDKFEITGVESVESLPKEAKQVDLYAFDK